MTDRDRLIELLGTAHRDFDGNIGIVKLADHLLENGVIVPHCKVGTKVYAIRARGARNYGKHRKYDYSPDTTFSLNNAISQKATLYIEPKQFCKTDKVRLNKTVFLTKEEAEEKLKELVKNG